MPSITDWLMVGITLVYVIATIVICFANFSAAKASREQLAESKRQYEDKKRLEIMPYLQFEQTNDDEDHELYLALESGQDLYGEYIIRLRIKNVGIGTAKDIGYTYMFENYNESYDRGSFPACALTSGESQVIKIYFCHRHEMMNIAKRYARIIFRIRDLLDNNYTQKLDFVFEVSNSVLRLDSFTAYSPELVTSDSIEEE